jgi:pSer/pThr/pTyr-binding forkhead associated (FHA) protein
MFELAICNGSGDVLRRYDLSRVAVGGRRVVIGRAEDCDIRIRNGAISRHHAAIEALAEDEWVIRDLGSTCGCLVSGERVSEAEIHPGLQVAIGPAILRFESVASRIAADLDRELSED